jgi:NTE family protein
MTLRIASPARLLFCPAHLLLLFVAILVAGCGSDAHYPVNAPLGHKDAKEAYRLQRVADDPANPGDVLVVLSFSGGGTRAAALAYGTLEALRDVSLPIGGTQRRLLDEVDIVNAVSGGSVTAAYYAVHRDAIFRDFETRFLHRDVEGDLKRRVAANMTRLASKHFGRTDLLAEYFDELLFKGKTFGDLAGGAFRPFVVINAADLSTGARFPFTQGQFDLLCSDLGHVPVARAVAASAALPPYFTAITLRNYAGGCEVVPPAGLAAATRGPAGRYGELARVREARSYQDHSRRPYIHLVDGGLIDNLGVRAAIDFAVENGGFLELVDALGYHDLAHAVFISVNAQRGPDLSIDQSDEVPSFRRVMRAFELPVNAQSVHISDQLHASFERWRDEIARRRPSGPADRHTSPRFYFIDVSLQAIPDEGEREYFKQVPTALTLDAKTVGRLRAVARQLLLDSPDFKQLVKDLGG